MTGEKVFLAHSHESVITVNQRSRVFTSYLELSQSAPSGSEAASFCTQPQLVKLDFLPPKQRPGMIAVPGRWPEAPAILAHNSRGFLGNNASQIVRGLFGPFPAPSMTVFDTFVQFYTFFVWR